MTVTAFAELRNGARVGYLTKAGGFSRSLRFTGSVWPTLLNVIRAYRL